MGPRREDMPTSTVAVSDKTRAALGVVKLPSSPSRRDAELLSREDFARRAPWEVLENDDVKRGEVPLTPGDVVGGTILLWKANDAYVRSLMQHNPAYLEQLVREQGEIARTEPFRPGIAPKE